MNTTTRIWAIASGAGVLLVLVGGFFLGVQPQLTAASTSSDSATSVEAQNQQTMIKVAQLSKAAAKIDTLEAQNDVLLKSVPSILKPNTFIRRINEVAALDGVAVGSIVLGDAVPYTAPQSSGVGPSLSIAKTDGSITPANFTSVPATIIVIGSEAAVMQFGHDIQNDERVFAINNVQTTTSDTAAITATFSGFIYVLKR